MDKETKNKIIKFIERIACNKAYNNLFERQGCVLDEEKFLKINFNEIKHDYFDLWKSMFNEDLEEVEEDL